MAASSDDPSRGSDGDVDLAEVLRRHGHRVTEPRLAVWRALAETGRHVTVDELAGLLSGSDINVASIYRTLALLRDLGMVRESKLAPDEASQWEPAHPDEHIHLVCDRCGKIDHHVGSLVRNIERHLSEHHHFQVSGVEVVVRGVCPSCASPAS